MSINVEGVHDHDGFVQLVALAGVVRQILAFSRCILLGHVRHLQN